MKVYENCLYFNLSALTRKINKVWQDEFEKLGLSPSHGYLLVAIAENKGVSQKALSELMELDASTITRFVDALVTKGLVERNGKGKGGTLSVTTLGKSQSRMIENIMDGLFDRMHGQLGKRRFSSMVNNLQKARLAIQNEK